MVDFITFHGFILPEEFHANACDYTCTCVVTIYMSGSAFLFFNGILKFTWWLTKHEPLMDSRNYGLTNYPWAFYQIIASGIPLFCTRRVPDSSFMFNLQKKKKKKKKVSS